LRSSSVHILSCVYRQQQHLAHQVGLHAGFGCRDCTHLEQRKARSSTCHIRRALCRLPSGR
jgi:hypothetical protein